MTSSRHQIHATVKDDEYIRLTSGDLALMFSASSCCGWRLFSSSTFSTSLLKLACAFGESFGRSLRSLSILSSILSASSPRRPCLLAWLLDGTRAKTVASINSAETKRCRSRPCRSRTNDQMYNSRTFKSPSSIMVVGLQHKMSKDLPFKVISQ